MYLKTQGLILRVTDYNDRDALVTMLTPNHGKLTVKARSLRRKNSPLSATCQLLAYSEFTLFEYKGMYSVNEAESVELFTGLRKDICKLSLGTYFAQVAELISQEDLSNPELLSLVLNCLFALSKTDEPERKIKAAFELRCACLAGFQPDLGNCYGCGAEQADMFDLSAGHLSCFSCRADDASGVRMPINPSILNAMRYICTCMPKKLLSFQLGDENLLKLSDITEGYLLTQLERGFSTLDFYKSLMI
ncbi:MAG: DNA repair protein RecO [Oscillospiraceae bacterium]|nr:DNA repair protein RecO [Oscillospiraceae bacterium]